MRNSKTFATAIYTLDLNALSSWVFMNSKVISESNERRNLVRSKFLIIQNVRSLSPLLRFISSYN